MRMALFNIWFSLLIKIVTFWEMVGILTKIIKGNGFRLKTYKKFHVVQSHILTPG